MKIQDIPFAQILQKNTVFSDTTDRVKTNTQEFFNDITSLLCDFKHLNISTPYRYDLCLPKITCKPGMYKTRKSKVLIHIDFNSLCVHCIPHIAETGKFTNLEFPNIITNLYHYSNELKTEDRTEEYRAVKRYLNCLYGFTDHCAYSIYESYNPYSSFQQDIIEAANVLLCSVIQNEEYLYVDTDMMILYVPNVANFNERLQHTVKNIMYSITELSKVAIIGKKQLIAIDTNNHYHSI